jgi:hypothetical protein
VESQEASRAVSLDIFLRLRAAQTGRAQPRATRRHVHVTARPLVVVGCHLVGDPAALVALRYGTTPEWSRTVVVPDPRDPAARNTRLAEFAGDLVRHLAGFTERAPAERAIQGGVETQVLATEAPQLICPNPSTAAWLTGALSRLLCPPPSGGCPPDGLPPDPVRWQAGAHLAFFARRRALPGSSAVLAATELLTTHWVTGQLPGEDGNLGVLLAWLEPPARTRAPVAAAHAELGPPAGPVSDPRWDREVLWPLLRGAPGAGGPEGTGTMDLAAACTGALAPAWRHTWQALALVRALPEAGHVSDRWFDDRLAWTRHGDRMAAGAPARPGPDGLEPFRSRQRLEARTVALARQMALDDPLLLAARVVAGEAMAGEVVARDCANRVASVKGRGLLRPVLWVRPAVPFDRPAGTALWWADDTRVRARVVSISGNGTVELMVVAGAGAEEWRAGEILPQAGERVRFVGAGDDRLPDSSFPDGVPEDLPWTHLATAVGAGDGR